MQHTSLLIVEDDSIFLNALVWQLSKMGYDRMNIMSVTSIAEAKEIASEFVPDVILLDLNITDSHGVETYNSIIKLYTNSAVVILSGMNDEDLALDIVKKGAQDYLLKSDVSSKILSKTIEYSKERKNLIGQLQMSELKYRNVFNQSPLPMFIVEQAEQRIIQANQAAILFYGFGEAEILSKSMDSFSVGERALIKKEEDAFHFSCVHQNKKGNQLHVEVLGKKINDEEGEEYICLIVDKTAEWEFEQKKYKVISAAQENEKKKIAMELHDGLVQSLALLSIWFNNLNISDDQKNLKDMFVKHLDNAIKESRGIAYILSPPDLEEGFLHALSTLTERINRVGNMKVHLDVGADVEESSFAHIDKFNLYRILQEFINNSTKHSGSTRLDIQVLQTDKGLLVKADDHGKGFDMADHTNGLGIKSLEHRIKLGSLCGGVSSKVGEGTKLEIQVC
jgi:two-component system sensor histidine kinase UhpB